jgi:hypothetical protein
LVDVDLGYGRGLLSRNIIFKLSQNPTQPPLRGEGFKMVGVKEEV